MQIVRAFVTLYAGLALLLALSVFMPASGNDTVTPFKPQARVSMGCTEIENTLTLLHLLNRRTPQAASDFLVSKEMGGECFDIAPVKVNVEPQEIMTELTIQGTTLVVVRVRTLDGFEFFTWARGTADEIREKMAVGSGA